MAGLLGVALGGAASYYRNKNAAQFQQKQQLGELYLNMVSQDPTTAALPDVQKGIKTAFGPDFADAVGQIGTATMQRRQQGAQDLNNLFGGGGQSAPPPGGVPRSNLPTARGVNPLGMAMGQQGAPPLASGAPMAPSAAPGVDFAGKGLPELEQEYSTLEEKGPAFLALHPEYKQALDDHKKDLQFQISKLQSQSERAETQADSDRKFAIDTNLRMQEIGASTGIRDATLALAKSQDSFNDSMKVQQSNDARTQKVQGQYNLLVASAEKINSQLGDPKKNTPEQIKSAISVHNEGVDQLKSLAKRYNVPLDDMGINPDDLRKSYTPGGTTGRATVLGVPIPGTGTTTNPSITSGAPAPTAAPSGGLDAARKNLGL